MPDLEILHFSVDDAGDESHFRILVDGKDFKYVSIDSDVYDLEDLFFPPSLIPQLPEFPSGEWNLGRITKSEDNNSPHFDWTTQKALASIQHTWHPVLVDYLSLTMGDMLLPNVYEVTTPNFDVPVIAKFARFPWEVDYYNQETQVYSWIKGHEIGPEFLGHITEGERVIGFLLQKVPGRHAGPADLQACCTVVSRLHSLGIHHGDLNKHNFLVQESRTYLIDFESSRKVDDQEDLVSELENVEGNICSDSRRGGNYTDVHQAQG